tara:strand:+ start:297 stop:539 length:243 start_codon:yes stop_codon:yes gene_type:complete
VKTIKKNDLLPWFTMDHGQLPASYLRSCEKFFRELKNPGVITAFQEAKAPSAKLQATSMPQSDAMVDPLQKVNRKELKKL